VLLAVDFRSTAKVESIGEAGHAPGLAVFLYAHGLGHGLRCSRLFWQFHTEVRRQASHVLGHEYTPASNSQLGLGHEVVGQRVFNAIRLHVQKASYVLQAH
jgi:hypothetical protein